MVSKQIEVFYANISLFFLFAKFFVLFFMIRAFFAESASRGFWLLMFDDSSAAAAVADFCILGHVGNLAGEMACLSRFLLDAAFWEE